MPNMITSHKETNQHTSSNELEGLLTVKQFCLSFPWPSESALRAYIFRANELGLVDAFVRVHRRVLIIPQKFFSLIRQVENRSNIGGAYEKESWNKGEAHL